METITIVIIVILLIALGIFVGVQISGNSVRDSSGSYSSYPSQYSGGGCGR